MDMLTRRQFNAIFSAAVLAPRSASAQTVTPSFSDTTPAVIDAAPGLLVTLMPLADDAQPVGVPLNLADGQEMQINLIGGGGSGSWKTWQSSSPTTPGYVFVTGAAPTAGVTAGDIVQSHVKRIGVQYVVTPGTSAVEDLSRYDIVFGEGLDPATRCFFPNLALNPGETPPVVVFYTPAGANTGPTTMTLKGVSCQVYTRTGLAAMGAVLHKSGINADGSVASGTPVGDWILFPQGTLNVPADTHGETFYGEIRNSSGASIRYPTVFGTYDSTDMYDPAKWNNQPCMFDFSANKYPAGTNGFFFNLGRNEQNFAFINLQARNTNARGCSPFYTNVGIHRNFLFERTTMDNKPIYINGASGAQVIGAAITSIASAGTTATVALSSATFMARALASQSAGIPVTGMIYGCTGATASAYNTPLDTTGSVITITSPTTFTYQMASDAGGVAATGAPRFSVRVDAPIADAAMSTNYVFNQCGQGYSANGPSTNGRSINLFISGVKRLRFHDLVNVHGNWARSATRSAPSFVAPRPIYPATAATRVGATIVWAMPNTGTLAAGGFMYVKHSRGQDGLAAILSVVPNVSVTTAVDANIGYTYIAGLTITGYIDGNTLYASSVLSPNSVSDIYKGLSVIGAGAMQASITAGRGSTWTLDGSAQTVGSSSSPVTFNLCANIGDPLSTGFDANVGDPPDIFGHGLYINDDVSDIRMFDTVNAWDGVNQKLTGGPYTIRGWCDIRCPMSFITNGWGNDADGFSWAQGSTMDCKDFLQVFSDDMTPHDARGNAPWLPESGRNTRLRNALILNATNPTPASRSGITAARATSASGMSLGATFGYHVDHMVMASWGGNDVSQSPARRVDFAYNITDDTSVLPATVPPTGSTIVPNVSNKLLSSTPAAFQAGIKTALSRNIANTFRLATPELAGVTVVGDGSGTDLATELACFDVMLYNPGVRWGPKIHAHWRAPIGR